MKRAFIKITQISAAHFSISFIFFLWSFKDFGKNFDTNVAPSLSFSDKIVPIIATILHSPITMLQIGFGAGFIGNYLLPYLINSLMWGVALFFIWKVILKLKGRRLAA